MDAIKNGHNAYYCNNSDAGIQSLVQMYSQNSREPDSSPYIVKAIYFDEKNAPFFVQSNELPETKYGTLIDSLLPRSYYLGIRNDGPEFYIRKPHDKVVRFNRSTKSICTFSWTEKRPTGTDWERNTNCWIKRSKTEFSVVPAPDLASSDWQQFLTIQETFDLPESGRLTAESHPSLKLENP